MLNKGSGYTRPWFVFSAKLNSTAAWFIMCACRNRFIHVYAEVILFPASIAYFYFLFLISTFLSFKVVSHRQVFR
jgi:hypothetical protein